MYQVVSIQAGIEIVQNQVTSLQMYSKWVGSARHQDFSDLSNLARLQLPAWQAEGRNVNYFWLSDILMLPSPAQDPCLVSRPLPEYRSRYRKDRHFLLACS